MEDRAFIGFRAASLNQGGRAMETGTGKFSKSTMVKMIYADILQIDAGWEGSECHPIN
jgi:hypothetical protein